MLWSDLGSTHAHESQPAQDILSGAVRRDDASSDVLYFKFRVDPLSDVSTEEYLAAFQLSEKGEERLGIGNSLKAWAYSAFNTTASGEFNRIWGDMDLRSLQPEPAGTPGEPLPYELPRRGIERTIAFKVKFIPGADDQVTVWLNPDLTTGAGEEKQDPALVTRFEADASFDEIRLKHSGGGRGWIFSDMAIATSFADLIGGGGVEGALSGAVGSAARMTVRSWQREQGLPQNEVRALAQTTDGYVWLGSDDGVTRFDGVRFVNFGPRDGLPSGPVGTLLADRSGALWVGTVRNGLGRMQGDAFDTWTAQNGLPSDEITSIAEDSHGQVWVGTAAGLALIRDERVVSFEAASGFKGKGITTLYRDPHGLMWVGVEGEGVFGFREGLFIPLPDAGVEGLLKDPHCILHDRSGRVWVGAGDDFLLCRESNSWRRYRIPRHLSRPYVTALAEEPNGSVWAGSVSEGLFEIREGRLNPLDATDGMPDNFVEALMVDREGNLWVGTGAGLSRLRRSRLLAFGQGHGLGYGPVQGLAEVAPGVIWACKAGDGLYRWQGTVFNKIPGISLADEGLHSILPERDGTVWVGGSGGILHFKNALETIPVAEPAALEGKHVTALAHGIDRRIWAGTRGGELWRSAGEGWDHVSTLEPAVAITALVPQSDEGVWVGTEGSGVALWRRGWTERVTKRSGLLSDVVRTLHLGDDGVLWIGTSGGGLARLMGGRVDNFTSRDGLPDDSVVQIVDDRAGTLWLGTRRGIAGVSKRDLANVAAGLATAVYPQIYGRTEGMASEECVSGFFPSALRVASGLMWFSTLKGIVIVDPRTRLSDPPPLVRIEEVVVDEVSVDFRPTSDATFSKPGFQIAPGKRRIEFHFTGLSFSAPDRVRFRYRLEGLDPGWVEAGTRRTAFYGYLPPGDYRFHVIACNTAGVWNEAGAALSLTVMRRFYESTWFIGLSAVVLVGVVAGSVRLGVKRKLQRRLRQLEQERAVERERARIAQDLHDELGSSLTRLSLLSDLLEKEHRTDPEQAALHASRISQTSTQTVRALEEIVWALRPGSDTVQSLIEYIAHVAKEMFEGDSAQCRLDLPDSVPAWPLPPEMRHNIFLIVKEALTNSLRHAKARKVLVQAKVIDGALEIVVADDGSGFARSSPSDGAGHNGLGNMQRRAEAMGGELRIETAPGTGTRVSITVHFDRPRAGSATTLSNGHNTKSS